MINYPYTVPALLIEQEMGVFYAAVLPAKLLLDVAFSDILSAEYDETTERYTLDGTQRLRQPKRLKPIADYIDRVDSCFPNAIILAANYRNEDGLIEDAPEDLPSGKRATDRRWTIESQVSADGKTESFLLTIPTPEKLAAIIDGQHRLFAFTEASPERMHMQLLCSIFLDLPKPYQAQLFATINSTQKPVDKSLTFELFGYNVSEEKSEFWSPDKLAVFLSRRLATEEDSPLRGRIVISPRKDKALDEMTKGRAWKVSTAVVVEGIMKLFTSNPKKDTNFLMTGESRRRNDLTNIRNDRTPLRTFYLEGNDVIIYQIVKNYLIACEKTFWSKTTSDSYITKTVGVQALFDVLRTNISSIVNTRDISVERFMKFLAPAASIDFRNDSFKNASGSGRTYIRKTLQREITGVGIDV